MGGLASGVPLELFRVWFEQAMREEERAELTALATASSDGRPSVRMVELQAFDDRGFVFYTGLTSRKGADLDANPQAALCFYWHDTGHQVRVEGSVEPVSLDPEEARAARHTDRSGPTAMPPQGAPIGSAADLEKRLAQLRARYGENAEPLPTDWGAFRVVPDAFEFWEFRENHLHDRWRYSLEGGDWKVSRLFP